MRAEYLRITFNSIVITCKLQEIQSNGNNTNLSILLLLHENYRKKFQKLFSMIFQFYCYYMSLSRSRRLSVRRTFQFYCYYISISDTYSIVIRLYAFQFYCYYILELWLVSGVKIEITFNSIVITYRVNGTWVMEKEFFQFYCYYINVVKVCYEADRIRLSILLLLHLRRDKRLSRLQ